MQWMDGAMNDAWFEIRSTAFKNGELVYSFDQSIAGDPSYAGKFDPAANVKAGYCLGLAVQWIGLRLRGKDFEWSGKRSLSPSATYAAASVHATYLKSFNEGHASLRSLLLSAEEVDTGAINVALVPFGLKLSGETMSNKGRADAGKILGAASTTRGIALMAWHGTWGAHATAIDVRPAQQTVNYFDANYGHFAFSSGPRFVAWFGTYLRLSSYESQLADRQALQVLGLA